MKKYLSILTLFSLIAAQHSFAQQEKKIEVPKAVKDACKQKYPQARNVTWEKEKGNYEANWGGRSGEDNSVQFTPTGEFVEIVKAMPLSGVPKNITSYVRAHYKGARITEAGRVTDAQGKHSYEVEVNHKDLIFDEQGNFSKAED